MVLAKTLQAGKKNTYPEYASILGRLMVPFSRMEVVQCSHFCYQKSVWSLQGIDPYWGLVFVFAANRLDTSRGGS